MRNTLLILLSAIALCRSAVSGSPREQIKPLNVNDAITKLADEDFHVRESASRWLWTMGKACESHLQAALKSRDPEVAMRAQNILENFRYGILPDTPAGVAELLAHYRDADATGRSALLESVPIPPSVDQLRALLTLSELESDKALKDSIHSRIAQIPPEGVMKIIAENETGLAEQVLTLSALTGDENAIKNLGALLLMTDGVARKLENLEAGQGTSPEKRKLLAFLQRLAGRETISVVKKDEDFEATEQALLVQHNWQGLADLIPGQLQQNDEYVERLALLAASQRQSGRVRDAEHTINLIRQCANDAADEDLVRRCARALLANDKPQEALETLLDKEVVDDAFKLLCAQSRFEEAFVLIERVSTPGPQMARLRIAMAEAHTELGEKKRALKNLDEAGELMRERPRYDILLLLIKAERALGRAEQALEHSIAAIKLNPGASPDEVLHYFFSASNPQVQARRGSLAVRWWAQLQFKQEEDVEKRLRLVKSIVDQTVALDEFEKLAAECLQHAEQNSSANNSEDEGVCLTLLAETWLAFGRQDTAQEYFQKAVRSRRNVDPALIALGNLAVERKQWVRAAEFYRQAWEYDFSNAAALYLRGWALAQSGQERSGKTCMDRASILPLGDATRRKNLRAVLKRLNHASAAQKQDEMMALIDADDSTAAANLLNTRYEALVASGDFRQAADVLQQRVIQKLNDDDHTTASAGEFLNETFQIHLWRAKSALQTGDIEGAQPELQICNQLNPGSADVAMAIIPDLQNRGLQREARELLDRAIAAQQRVLERYPDSAVHQSNLRKLQRLAGNLPASK